MKTCLAALAIVALPAVALAESKPVDTNALPSNTVWDVAELTPLAVTADGTPAVVLLELGDGVVVPPHATDTGLRLLTVLSGEMSWGNGETVDEAAETVYPAGTILTVPAGSPHWLAARSGPVRLTLVLLDDETPVPALAEQM